MQHQDYLQLLKHIQACICRKPISIGAGRKGRGVGVRAVSSSNIFLKLFFHVFNKMTQKSTISDFFYHFFSLSSLGEIYHHLLLLLQYYLISQPDSQDYFAIYIIIFNLP